MDEEKGPLGIFPKGPIRKALLKSKIKKDEVVQWLNEEVLLYHLTEPENVASIMKTGIRPAEITLKRLDPRRERAVFAFTPKALERELRLATSDKAVIVFRTKPDNWLCGDMQLDYSPEEYRKTIRPLKEILEKPSLEREYQQMECFLPNGYIPIDKIIEVKFYRRE